MPFTTPIENIFSRVERTNIEKIIQTQREQQEMLEKIQLQQLRSNHTSNNCGYCNCGNHVAPPQQYIPPKVATASYSTSPGNSSGDSNMWERLLYAFVGVILGGFIGYYFGKRGNKYPVI
jgi:hypothetical protein